MEKLLKLLNECGKDFWHYEPYYGFYIDDKTGYEELRICSKSYDFIKRLVDNDKIDFEKYRIMDTKKYLHQHIIGNACCVDIRADVPNYEFILALLSIQDNPIKFLISILK